MVDTSDVGRRLDRSLSGPLFSVSEEGSVDGLARDEAWNANSWVWTVLAQFPSRCGRQLWHGWPLLTQAQFWQRPVRLHRQQVISFSLSSPNKMTECSCILFIGTYSASLKSPDHTLPFMVAYIKYITKLYLSREKHHIRQCFSCSYYSSHAEETSDISCDNYHAMARTISAIAMTFA